MTPIRAKDSCFLPFPRESVWRLIADIEGYSRWWPKKLRVRLISSGKNGVGGELEINPSNGRPFRCRVTSIDPPSRMDMQYFGGFVEGTGLWLLEPEGNGTRLVYSIDTRARGRLVALLGHLLDLGSIHSRQMQGVFHGLIHELNLQARDGLNSKA